ncbi:MAG: hypothetical protein DMF27_00740 [Verrucomicrobia bacterium]|nr:MAG: hypothetical protein DMF27_00740 [Verrucomicrobiota bacterium]
MSPTESRTYPTGQAYGRRNDDPLHQAELALAAAGNVVLDSAAGSSSASASRMTWSGMVGFISWLVPF